MSTYDPRCPAWCSGQHPRYLTDLPDDETYQYPDVDSVILHEYTFPGTPDVTDGAGTGHVEITLVQTEVYTDGGPCFPDPPALHATIPERDCSPNDLDTIAGALTRCATRARALIGDGAPSEPAPAVGDGPALTNAEVVESLESFVDWLKSQEAKHGPWLDPSSTLAQMDRRVSLLRSLTEGRA